MHTVSMSSLEPPISVDIFTITTGGEEEIQIRESRDSFFQKVLGELGLQHGNPFVEVKERPLGFENPEGFSPSDDKLHSLIIVDESVALVYDRRNDHNFHEVTFWRRTPSKRVVSFIKTMIK